MLANRQISLSHQINNEGKMVFIEDFLAEKQAEAVQFKAEQEAKVAEDKSQAEHQRQKELMELDVARAQAAAPPPPMVGAPQSQGAAPTWDGQSDNDEEGSGSNILEGIFALVVIAAIGVGGWYAYKHFSGPTLEEVEAKTMAIIQLSYISDGKAHILESLTLQKTGDGRYSGTAIVTHPRVTSLITCDVTVKLDGDKVVDWSITNK